MSELSADELAIVAREVTGNSKFIVDGDAVQAPHYWDTDGSSRGPYPWDPFYNSEQWQSLIEWLADRIPKALDTDFVLAIKARNIAALQRMVIELRNPK